MKINIYYCKYQKLFYELFYLSFIIENNFSSIFTYLLFFPGSFSNRKKLCNNAFIHVCIFITTIDQSKGCLAWEVNQPCCYDWMVSNGLQNLSHAFPCLIHVQRNHYHFQMTHDIYDTPIWEGNVSMFWKWKAS